MQTTDTYRLFFNRLTRVRLGFLALAFACVCALFATFPQAAFASTEDATFFVATYTGDSAKLPGSLKEVEDCVSGYSSGISLSGALIDPQDETFSSEGLGSNVLKACPTVEQIQAVYSYDPSTQYIIWYVVKSESDGWHVDGALISRTQESGGDNTDPSQEDTDPEKGENPPDGEDTNPDEKEPVDSSDNQGDKAADEVGDPKTDSDSDPAISENTTQNTSSENISTQSSASAKENTSNQSNNSESISSANSNNAPSQNKDDKATTVDSKESKTVKSKTSRNDVPTSKGPSEETLDLSDSPIIQASHTVGAYGMAASLAAAIIATITSLSGALKAQALASKMMKGFKKR